VPIVCRLVARIRQSSAETPDTTDRPQLLDSCSLPVTPRRQPSGADHTTCVVAHLLPPLIRGRAMDFCVSTDTRDIASLEAIGLHATSVRQRASTVQMVSIQFILTDFEQPSCSKHPDPLSIAPHTRRRPRHDDKRHRRWSRDLHRDTPPSTPAPIYRDSTFQTNSKLNLPPRAVLAQTRWRPIRIDTPSQAVQDPRPRLLLPPISQRPIPRHPVLPWCHHRSPVRLLQTSDHPLSLASIG
jgi:hypothetical protein